MAQTHQLGIHSCNICQELKLDFGTNDSRARLRPIQSIIRSRWPNLQLENLPPWLRWIPELQQSPIEPTQLHMRILEKFRRICYKASPNTRQRHHNEVTRWFMTSRRPLDRRELDNELKDLVFFSLTIDDLAISAKSGCLFCLLLVQKFQNALSSVPTFFSKFILVAQLDARGVSFAVPNFEAPSPFLGWHRIQSIASVQFEIYNFPGTHLLFNPIGKRSNVYGVCITLSPRVCLA
jgi:hypothetical protein